MKRKKSSLRSYMFYGLTLVLAAVFIFLAIQNKRMEKEGIHRGREKEEVQGFVPTPIRSLAPRDLELEPNPVPLNRNGGAAQPRLFSQRIEIRNSGPETYQEILLKLEYLDASGKAVGSATSKIAQQIPPGHTFLQLEVSFDTIPQQAAACRLSVVYADMSPEEKKATAR